MIESFGDGATGDLFHGRRSKGTRSLPPSLIKCALRELDMLNAAHRIDDLKVPPANRLEALKAKGEGYHSIRINDQYRVVFRWKDGQASDVQIVDYH